MKRHYLDEDTVSVFYNSACPVCNAGITKQKKRMDEVGLNLQKIQWKDVHVNNDLVCELNENTTLDFARERLHVIDTEGDIQVGIDAFIALWKISPNEVWKAKVLEKPLIHSLARFIYNAFAFCLFQWNRLRGSWS